MLKKIFLVLLLLIFNNLQGFCSYETDIEKLEMEKYGFTYPNDSLASRLARLENDYFGMTQSSSIESRIYLLNKMAKAVYNNPLRPNDNYYLGKKKSKIRNFWNAIGDITGSMTGFTPPIYPEEYLNGYSSGYSSYNSYIPPIRGNNGYYPNRYYNNGMCPYNNYHPQNTNFLTRSSVHILND